MGTGVVTTEKAGRQGNDTRIEGVGAMALKTRKFDVAKFLGTDQDVALTLSEALETGDAATVAHALGSSA